MILPEGEPIFSEMTTTVRIEDEAAGPFVVIEQINDHAKPGRIAFSSDEWPMIKKAIEEMFKVCERLDNQGQEDKCLVK